MEYQAKITECGGVNGSDGSEKGHGTCLESVSTISVLYGRDQTRAGSAMAASMVRLWRRLSQSVHVPFMALLELYKIFDVFLQAVEASLSL